MSPDQSVRDAIHRIERDVSKRKRNKNWQDDVERMHEELEKEGIKDTIVEAFSPVTVKWMASRLGLIREMSLDLMGNDPEDSKP